MINGTIRARKLSPCAMSAASPLLEVPHPPVSAVCMSLNWFGVIQL